MQFTRKRQTIEGWLNEAIGDVDKLGPDGKPRGCSMVALVHLQGGAPIEVHSKPIKVGTDVTAIANFFQGKAEAYCQDMDGLQRFQLFAFYGTTEPQARFQFTIHPQGAVENGGHSDPPDAKGERAQSMRHLENLQAQYMRGIQNVIGSQEIQITQLMRRNEIVTQENHDAITILKEIMLEKSVTQHDLEMKRLQFERSTVERQKLIGMVPALANTLTGKQVFPQATEDTALIELIAEHVQPEAMMTLAQSLPAPVLAAIGSRMEKYKKKKEFEERRMRELAAQSTVAGELGEDSGGESIQ